MFPQEGPMGHISPLQFSESEENNFFALDVPADHGPTGYERPDMLILDDIVKALAWDPIVPATTLEISCVEGIVSISGTIPASFIAKRIEFVAATVIGIKGIDVDVRVDEAWMPVRPFKDEPKT